MPGHARRVGWLPVAVVVVVSTLIRVWAARHVEAPWIAPDETIYALLGRSLWHTGSFSLLGGDTGLYSLLYPAVIGVPLTVLGPESGLAVVQAVQAFAMSSVAVVAFAWGRRVVGESWALVAAVLSVLLPGLAYSGLLMTETLFYPVVALALWALWGLLVRPSLARQGLFVASAGLAVLTRVQALALLPAAVLAIGVFCAFRRDLTILRRTAPLLGLVVAAGVLALGVSIVTGSSGDVVGAYAAATGGYELGPAVKDVFWHAGGVFVIVAGVPLVALGALVTECARGRESDTAAALVATALAWTAISVVEVGVFASRWVGHIAERDLLTVAPPLFLVLVLWLARGVPRPQPVTSAVAVAVAAPALFLPVARFANQEAALDAFTFIPLWQLREATSTAVLQVAYALAVGLVVVAAVLLPRAARLALVGLVTVTLLAAAVVSAHEVERLARADRAWVFSTAQPRWIDDVADGPVAYIHAETAFPAAVWKTIYWNKRVDRVLRFDGTPPAAPLPERLAAPGFDGLVLDALGERLPGGFVAASSNIALAGKQLASYGPATDMPGMTLWQADTPLRVRWTTSGVQPNGDIVGTARVQVLGCTTGHLSLTLLGKQGTPVRISVVGRPRVTVTPAPGSVWRGDVPAPAAADGTTRCVYEIDSPGLVGSTRIEFVAD